jgi:hypothetical protein
MRKICRETKVKGAITYRVFIDTREGWKRRGARSSDSWALWAKQIVNRKELI